MKTKILALVAVMVFLVAVFFYVGKNTNLFQGKMKLFGPEKATKNMSLSPITVSGDVEVSTSYVNENVIANPPDGRKDVAISQYLLTAYDEGVTVDKVTFKYEGDGVNVKKVKVYGTDKKLLGEATIKNGKAVVKMNPPRVHTATGSAQSFITVEVDIEGYELKGATSDTNSGNSSNKGSDQMQKSTLSADNVSEKDSSKIDLNSKFKLELESINAFATDKSKLLRSIDINDESDYFEVAKTPVLLPGMK